MRLEIIKGRWYDNWSIGILFGYSDVELAHFFTLDLCRFYVQLWWKAKDD